MHSPKRHKSSQHPEQQGCAHAVGGLQNSRRSREDTGPDHAVHNQEGSRQDTEFAVFWDNENVRVTVTVSVKPPASVGPMSKGRRGTLECDDILPEHLGRLHLSCFSCRGVLQRIWVSGFETPGRVPENVNTVYKRARRERHASRLCTVHTW